MYKFYNVIHGYVHAQVLDCVALGYKNATCNTTMSLLKIGCILTHGSRHARVLARVPLEFKCYIYTRPCLSPKQTVYSHMALNTPVSQPRVSTHGLGHTRVSALIYLLIAHFYNYPTNSQQFPEHITSRETCNC